MSIGTYDELKTAVGRWMKRPNLSDYFAEFIRLGEVRLARRLRLRAMETSFEGTISSGVLALPTNYVELKFAYIEGNPVRTLERKTDEWIMSSFPTRASDGKPSYIARQGSNFIFGPYPDDTYTVKGSYYQRFTALSDTNPEGWLVVNAPDLILFASLVEGFLYAEDDAMAVKWEGRMTAALDDLMREETNEDFSGSPLAVTAR